MPRGWARAHTRKQTARIHTHTRTSASTHTRLTPVYTHRSINLERDEARGGGRHHAHAHTPTRPHAHTHLHTRARAYTHLPWRETVPGGGATKVTSLEFGLCKSVLLGLGSTHTHAHACTHTHAHTHAHMGIEGDAFAPHTYTQTYRERDCARGRGDQGHELGVWLVRIRLVGLGLRGSIRGGGVRACDTLPAARDNRVRIGANGQRGRDQRQRREPHLGRPRPSLCLSLSFFFD